MNLRYIIFVLLTLFISKLCIPSAFSTNKTGLRRSKEDILKNVFKEYQDDREFRKLIYYREGKLVSKTNWMAYDDFEGSFKSIAEQCKEYLTENGLAGGEYPMNLFFKKMADFDFTNMKKCEQYQDFWNEKNRTDVNLLVRYKFGNISNVNMYATTLPDPRICSIVESFMMRIEFLIRSKFMLEGLNACIVANDRPATVMYYVLDIIRINNPKGLSTPVKRSLDEISRINKKYMPLYKNIRERNNVVHSINLLFLSKRNNIKNVRSIENLGLAKVIVNYKLMSNRYFISEFVSEHLDPLFQVCRNRNQVKTDCNRY